ncbi:transketolase C-terminal domain-containing protein [Rhodocista pekingensis]|uniref:Transketolase C-terminal domain-containing protein n=1 Tax=Rhodocista pekingensis TaxID=201185 RepID=A0ABW2L157_9PROT
MGEQITLSNEAGALFHVPQAEFRRLLDLPLAPPERAALFADLCRLNTLYMITRAGSGHIGSSFSSLDIVSWLHLCVLRPGHDLYFSSKGHDAPGLYAVLTALGTLPFEKIHGLRRLGGLPGHPDVAIPGMVANTGSLGMGISKAKGMAEADRVAGRPPRRLFVLTGDGELQEGQVWESLVSAANRHSDGIVAIVDHNKLQSDTFVRRVSDLGDLEAKFRAFGWSVLRADGHDIPAVAAALDALLALPGPRVLIADTVKGRGVSFMEHTALPPEQEFYRFHSGAPSRPDYARATQELADRINGRLAAAGAAPLVLEAETVPATAAPPGVRLIPAYTEALLDAAGRLPHLVALDADLILDTGLIPFRDRFPDRFIECGIAEQDMVSQASGMALAGLLPVVHSFACFLTARPNEQIYNACSEGKRIVFVGSLAGLLPAGPGHSHQSVRDLAAMGAMPGLTMVEPSCPAAVGPLLRWCLEAAPAASYLRLVSIPCDVPFALPDGWTPEPGRGTVLRPGRDGAVIAYGPVMLTEAWHALDRLEREQGLRLALIDLPWLNRVDPGWLAETLAGLPLVVSIDNHFRIGGQGDRIAEALAARSGSPPLLRFCVERLPDCGRNDEVLKAHGLDRDSLAAGILARLRP